MVLAGAHRPFPWLTERPIAHRGLHNAEAGVIENTLAAATAAIERGFAIECDVQLTSDGEAVVFHDFTLDRLTAGSGRVDGTRFEAVATLAMRGTGDRVPVFGALLAHIAGRVPLICEVKSRFDGDTRLADRVWQTAAGYDGPLALKSFDPAVIAHLRAAAAASATKPRPLGVVAQARYDTEEWDLLPAPQKLALSNFLHYRETRPDFLSYAVDDLPHAVPFLLRQAAGLPVMAWTVRTPDQRRRAAEEADQIVFEGFVP
ncbi:MAG: glycerophosphodiester phosphodiesterase [Methylobacteriaceae bacterium]|nr:glycerophosphodiester phosphodiesterase [Methylobacteriaceae bacterium]MBV9247492.1 glycerophosphodiester phosphodiesterase [Methylobacteriaceae bacterium]